MSSRHDETSVAMRQFEGAMFAGRYRLERLLDEGNFGAVFRAAQEAYGVDLREVAIKIGKRPMTQLEARHTFGDALTMLRLAARASDPQLRQHFVTVYDAGRAADGELLAGHPYVVMELVTGGSVASCLRPGPFPLTRAALYFDQILKAVAFMHGRGQPDGARPIAHRDLKPGNVLVTRGAASESDVLKVTDFGLAVEVESLLGWVESGGDLAYLAPESFSHNICSPQSDVYMLGLVFYEMLTKQRPFSAAGSHLRGDDDQKRAELRRIHLEARRLETFPHLERHDELKRRPALAAVIRRALSHDMASRYRDAGELHTAWAQAQRDTAPIAAAASVEPPWETVHRLTFEAEQCFSAAVNDPARGDALLADAQAINRDRRRVPPSMVVGRTYFLAVERRLIAGRLAEAGELAHEGIDTEHGRPCRSTLMAAARYYAAQGSPLAARFEQDALRCPEDWIVVAPRVCR